VKSWSEIQGSQPLFESFFVFENHPVTAGVQDLTQDTRFLASRVFESSAYPITIITEPQENICVRALFDKNRISSETAARILVHFQVLMASMSAHPEQKVGDLSLLRAAERQLRAGLPPVELDNVECVEALLPKQEEMLPRIPDTDTGCHFGQAVFTVHRELDVENFKLIWQKLADQNSCLRTSFHWQGLEQPVQVVHRHVTLPVEWQDWSHQSRSENESRFRKLLIADYAAGFQLPAAPLVRFHVLRFAPSDYRVVVSYHPVLIDSRSLQNLMDAALACHDAAQTASVEPGPAWANFATWLQDRNHARSEAFWREELSDFNSVSLLRAVLPQGPAVEKQPVSLVKAYLPRPVVERLHAYAASSGVDLRTIMHGAWAVLLSRYSGQEEVLFGVAMDGRPEELSEAKRMIGPFANVVPLRLWVRGDDFLTSWLKETGAREAEALNHQYLPLEKIRSCANWEPGFSFFDHVISYSEDARQGREMQQSEAIEFEPGLLFQGAFPFTIVVHCGKTGISVQCACSQPDIEEQSLAQLLEHYQQVLRDMVWVEEPIVESCASGAITVGV
jgi:hypothetical protein